MILRKNLISELSKESLECLELSVENEEDYNNIVSSRIDDLYDIAYDLGFRICNNAECREFRDEGYHTDDSLTFCSRECAETIIVDLEEEDYGDYIYYTQWWV